MPTTMKVASTVEGLEHAEPVQAGEVHIDFGFKDDFTAAMQTLNGQMLSFTEVVRVSHRAVNKMMKQFFPSSAYANGYRLVNKRGRNKLVEIK